MIEEFETHIDSGTPLEEVILVGFRDELTRAFGRVAGETFKEPP